MRELFPNCPIGRDLEIAEHACRKYSGRVGRTAGAKALDEKAILLAVIAYIRHAETNYEEFLAQGWDRWLARDEVADKVDQVLERWQGE